MISKLDARLMAKLRRPGSEKLLPPDPSATSPDPSARPREHWLKRWSNEDLWTRLF
jgi:hypothetical protein